MTRFEPNLAFAKKMDERDALRSFRAHFHFPLVQGTEAQKAIYFCGNSLGLQSQAARQEVMAELDRW